MSSGKYERDEEKINRQLKADYARLLNEGYCVFGCFLFGSQNYDLDHEDSDIDVKAIIIPELSPGYSRKWQATFFKPDNGHIDVITLNDFIHFLKTGYHSWVELLYTKYCYCPLKFRKQWKIFRGLRERITRYNDFLCLNSEIDYLNNQFQIAETKDEINDTRRENKRLAYVYRIKLLVDNYMAGLPYENNFHLSEENQKLLMFYKLESTYNLEERLAIMSDFISKANKDAANYKSSRENVIDKEVFEILETLSKEIVEVAK